ncbi:hypothetical protein [Burkholderia multivorans]|uniref:hypothetical protein n=1 Tax=Burkholderia multivorans TaxID=87883 RepID=UPI0011B1D8BA|nr:hypothetical protein [Burkholderia multivorans]MBJ9655365.1 hypothetical protein [Burkholderia multivorans]MBR8240642.1 hypothetical protein [Burkholderia multivorans]MBU9457289.1 hypothetical protein [Burkholderia multivorans]
MDNLDLLDSLAAEPVEQLVELVDLLLWGFADPRYWLSEGEVQRLIATLRTRPDVDSPPVQEAVATCAEYLRVACRGTYLRLVPGL